MPEVILERPRRRLAEVEIIREEILELNTDIKTKQEYILKRIHDNMYNEQNDEGYLEIDVREYEKCYHIDFEGIKACLDEEVDRLRNELRKSQEDSDNLVQKMQMFLKQNHQIVQDFLKTSHKAVYNLAKPSTRRGGNLVTNESNAMTERSEISETGTGEEIGWEPALSWVPAFGIEQANQLEWP